MTKLVPRSSMRTPPDDERSPGRVLDAKLRTTLGERTLIWSARVSVTLAWLTLVEQRDLLPSNRAQDPCVGAVGRHAARWKRSIHGGDREAWCRSPLPTISAALTATATAPKATPPPSLSSELKSQTCSPHQAPPLQ